jgi:phosphomannomutase
VALVKLLEKLGCKVQALHCNMHLPFPHPPEPVAENLADLVETIKSKKAEIGFAVDSDADRLAIVSEEGKPIGEELTLALAVQYILDKNQLLPPKKKIAVTNLSTSKVIDDLCRQFGATLIRTKIGEVHVAEELKDIKGLIGGEGNGGVIFPHLGFNRDSLLAAALVLNLMASSGEKISELAEGLPHYEMVKTKVECRSADEVLDFIDKTKNIFKGKDLVITDGIKVLLPGAWIHVRASNTEPVVRIIAEAASREKAEELIKKVLS